MYKITVAKNNEIQKIRSLEKQVWGEYVTSSYDMAFYVRFGYVFLAKQNNKIIGALVGLKTRDDEIKIVDWVVVKRFRKQGIGHALYKRLLIKTKDLPLIAFVKKDNEISIQGHIKLGFKRIKTLKNPFGLGDDSWYLMKKEAVYN